MKKEELIKMLKALPKGTEIAVLDWRKNLSEDSGEGSGAGLYTYLETEYHPESPNPILTINFDNSDYTDEGLITDKESHTIVPTLLKLLEFIDKKTDWKQNNDTTNIQVIDAFLQRE